MTICIVFLVALCNMTCLRASRVIVSLFALDLGAQQFWVNAPMLAGGGVLNRGGRA